VVNALRASDGHHGHSSPRGDGSDNLIVAAPLSAGSHDKSHMPGRRREDDENLVIAHTLTANYGKQVDNSDTNQGPPNLVFSNTAGDTALGLSLPRVPPLSTRHGDPGNLCSGQTVRRLTPLECEKLQAFPPGWTCLCGCTPYSTAACTCPDSPRYRALGNAVTVNVVQWIARRLRDAW
jgi:site-specific DNA-cytosine methylase